jgi:hypothetical protein
MPVKEPPFLSREISTHQVENPHPHLFGQDAQ